MSLDTNVLATAAGVVALTGTAMTLLAPQAAAEYQNFLEGATDENHARARVWSTVTRNTPLAALVPILALFAVAAVSERGFSAVSWTIVVVTVALQLGFVLLMRLLVQRVSRRMLILEILAAKEPSTSSRRVTGIQFDNRGPEELAVDWIDQQGNAKPYGFLPPDSITAFVTYAGHVWLVCDAKRGNEIGFYMARDEPAKAILE